MQIFVLALMLGVFAHDSQPGLFNNAAAIDGRWVALIVFLPKLALAGIFWLACRYTRARMPRPSGHKMLKRLERFTTIFRFAALALFGLDLYAGALDHIREALAGPGGNPIILDELLVMLPTLLLGAFSWWAYYPIDRRMREAALITRLDAGMPIHPVWTRGQYLLAQFRHQMVIMLAPLLALVAWREIVDRYGGGTAGGIDVKTILLVAGSGGLLLSAPVMIRHLWDTAPLPEGELRDRLVRLCKTHRVGVRQLLVWRTFGGMINAAVMGLMTPVRYILLTDALLEQVPIAQVEAVMAHEVAHVRKHHLAWLLVVLLAVAGFVMKAWELVIFGGTEYLKASSSPALKSYAERLLNHHDLMTACAALGALATGCAIFGWVSRRFERQADTFAVQHLATHDPPGGTPMTVITHPAIEAMTSALQAVADLNHINTRRRSWRHGSIAWRQAHLQGLVGRRPDKLWIDREVFWIKVAAALVLIGLVVADADLSTVLKF